MASKKKINKTAFVLANPKLAAKEVVALAKKEHKVALSEKYVYNIRAKAKASNGAPRRKPGRPPSKVNGSKRAFVKVDGSDDTEAAFVAVALDLGLGRAEALLRKVREAVATATQ